MKSGLITAAIIACFIAGSAMAANIRIKGVAVTADLTSLTNAQAAAYWKNIGPDLESAIAMRLGDMKSEEGSDIKIVIDEVSLANSFQTQLGLADSVLTGKVKVTSDNGMDIGNDYELKVTLQAANAFLGAGVAPATGFTGTPETYAALINAFADGVVTRLK